jgi:hypothetical protein
MNYGRTALFCSLGIISAAAPAHAELIAYEPFDYAEVRQQLQGKSGGMGFAGEWMRLANQWGGEVSNNYRIAEGSLTFGGLLTAGNRIRTDAVYWALLGRPLPEPIAADQVATKYLSFLVHPEEPPLGKWFGAVIVGETVRESMLMVLSQFPPVIRKQEASLFKT